MTVLRPSEVFPPIEPAQAGFDEVKLAQVGAFIESELAAGRFPGAGLVITRRQRTVLELTWGTYCSPVSRAVPYRLGVLNMLYSFSKVVSATVVVMAAQDGLVDYDLPVWHYIPEFKTGGKETITLRHLLTHSAGIPNAPLGPVLSDSDWQLGVKAVCGHPIEWLAGSKTLYHGLSGLFVAAEVVRRVSGYRTWQDICNERLFEPLESTFSFTIPEDNPVALTPQPKELPAKLEPGTYHLLGHPGGGCFGSLADTQKLLNMHLMGGMWNGAQLLKPAAFAEMHRVQYAEKIAETRERGQAQQHEYWALGWLTRGATSTGWFGFGDRASEASFGHAGIDTVMTVADPVHDLAITFMTTDSPEPSEDATRLRCTVTNLVVSALFTE